MTWTEHTYTSTHRVKAGARGELHAIYTDPWPTLTSRTERIAAFTRGGHG